MKAEEYYTWKELAVVDGESIPLLLTPWAAKTMIKSTPTIDYLCDTREQAFEVLETFGAKDEAEGSGWVLCKITIAPVEQLGVDCGETAVFAEPTYALREDT